MRFRGDYSRQGPWSFFSAVPPPVSLTSADSRVSACTASLVEGMSVFVLPDGASEAADFPDYGLQWEFDGCCENCYCEFYTYNSEWSPTCHDQDAFCVLKSHLASSEVKDEIDQDALHGEEPAQHSGGVPQVTKLHVDLIEKLAKGASRFDLANDVKAWHHW